MLEFQSEELNQRFKRSRTFFMGSYASTDRVWCNKTCRLFLLKTFPPSYNDEIEQEVKKEITKNFSMKHNNIVTYYEAFILNRDLAFTSQYMHGGSLNDKLNDKLFPYFDEEIVLNWFVSVLRGLNYLHENDVVHGNVKLGNILLTKKGLVKIDGFNFYNAIEWRKANQAR